MVFSKYRFIPSLSSFYHRMAWLPSEAAQGSTRDLIDRLLDGDSAGAQEILLDISPYTSLVHRIESTTAIAAFPEDAQGNVPSEGSLTAHSPILKAIRAPNISYLRLVDPNVACLGVVNKTVSMKDREPLCRACIMAQFGAPDGCPNSTHRNGRLAFPGPRYMIQLPIYTATTNPIALTMPYLEASSLPEAFPIDDLIALQAPPAIWITLLYSIDYMLSNGTLMDPAIPPDGPQAAPARLPTSVTSHPSSEDDRSALGSASVVSGLSNAGGSYIEVADPPSVRSGSASHSTPSAESFFRGQETSVASPLNELAALAIAEASEESSDASGSSESSDDMAMPGLRISSPPHVAYSSGGPGPSPDALASDRDVMAYIVQLQNSVRILEDKVGRLKLKQKRNYNIAKNATSSIAAQDRRLSNHIKEQKAEATSTKNALDLVQAKMDVIAGAGGTMAALEELVRRLSGRVGSLELDIRDDAGLFASLRDECREISGAGATGSFTMNGHTFDSEDEVLAMLMTITAATNGRPDRFYPDITVAFSLADRLWAADFEKSMAAKKASASAGFPNELSARISASHNYAIPPTIAKYVSEGDEADKITWCKTFSSYQSFTGTRQSKTGGGGKEKLVKELGRVRRSYKQNAARMIDRTTYPVAYEVSIGMIDMAIEQSLDFLSAINTFYEDLVSCKIEEDMAWKYIQDFILRFFENLRLLKTDLGEEDASSANVWGAMGVCNRVAEFSDANWLEHPSTCSMLVYTMMERLAAWGAGDDGDALVESAATAASEAKDLALSVKKELDSLSKKYKEEHQKVANLDNRLKQLGKGVGKGDRE